MYTKTAGDSGEALIPKRYQGGLQQAFVRIIQRHPAFEFGPAPTDNEQPIAVD